MSIVEKTRINTHYTRSVNLERDANSEAVVNAYIPTSRAVATLTRISDALGPRDAPRALALVGPYGSGKSSFAVYLSHLLGNPEHNVTKAARRILRKADQGLARRFTTSGRGTDGYCRALLTGSPEPLAPRLLRCLSDGASEFWSQRRGPNPAIVDRLAEAAGRPSLATTEIVKLVTETQRAVAKGGGQGVLIVIDELGKFLEYEARHYGANDIFLLQALAEHAFTGQDANLFVVVLLHQAFEQYARGLGEALRNEWAKVQGRYESIPFLESAEQVLRIVEAAFEQDLTKGEWTIVTDGAREVATALHAQKALPGVLDVADATELFVRCYPLHPISALLLPMLCQRVAQNERTLFSYLGSQEQHGLKDSIAKLNRVGDWIYPWEIYEYFILNQPAALNDHFTRRRWAEVVTAAERLGDAPLEQEQLLKTIGLFNIVSAQGGLKASKDLVQLCLPSKRKVASAARALQEQSLIQFRRFSGEYRVWQGTDFDLDEAIGEERNKLGSFDLATALNKRNSLLPAVARKYTIQTGALRYFLPKFVDANSLKTFPAQGETARILFFLTEGKGDKELFHSGVTRLFSRLDITVQCFNGAQLRDALAEAMALERIRNNNQELNADPVAQRELRDRLNAAEAGIDGMLRALLEEPGENEWYWGGDRLSITSKRSLQSALSRVLKGIYDSCPVIKNELINRDNPSSQAAAARNKLLSAMLNFADREDLGIDKFPAEKAIYRALLRATGIHRKVGNSWALVEPPEHDPCNVRPTWDRIGGFLDSTEKGPRAFTELDAVLVAPPYGVKAGILPILYIATYLVHQNELALYEEGHYTPYLTDEHIERFVRRPQDFAVQSFRIQGVRASIFREYAAVLYGSVEGDRTLLSIARPLAKFMGDLPDYARNTKRVSKMAQQVRDAFVLAKSPEQLLFETLPRACGLSRTSVDTDEAALKQFAKTLRDALRELKYAYSVLMDTQQERLAQAFNLDRQIRLGELRSILRGRVEGLDKYTVDVEGLRAYILRIAKPGGTDEEWFTNLLLFLGHKPARKWFDKDADAAEFRLSEFSRRLNDLEKLRVHYEGKSRKRGADFDVVLLRTVRQGSGEHDEVVCIDNRTREATRAVTAVIAEQLQSLTDKELQLTVIADLADDFLRKYRSSSRETGAARVTTTSDRKEGAHG